MDRKRTLIGALLATLSAPYVVAGPAAQDDDAREAWSALVAATRPGTAPADPNGPAAGAPDPDPIQAFHLQAEVLTREGVQTNETKIDYRFLAPDCIRFALPSKREVGRFGPRQRDYWLRGEKEGDVVVLSGKDYDKDRRQIDEMLAVARNFVALSDPARLTVSEMKRMSAPPEDLPETLRAEAAGLAWLAVKSPDFALLSPAAALREERTEAKTAYLVQLGLGEDGLPRFVVIREDGGASGRRRTSNPMLLRLSRFTPQDGFRIPREILVHTLDRRQRTAAFTAKPTQEVYVTATDLRPELTVEDFRPAPR